MNSSYIFTMISLGNFFFFTLDTAWSTLVPTANLSLKYPCIFSRTVHGHITPLSHCQGYFNSTIVADSVIVKRCLHVALVYILWVPGKDEHSPTYFTGKMCFFLFELFYFACVIHSFFYGCVHLFIIIIIADLKNL